MADKDLTLEELIDHPDTEDSSMTYLLTQLNSFGFPTTSWQRGGSIFSAMRSFARAMASFSPTVRDIARGFILKFSDWPWLEHLLDWYDETRIPATVAVGTVALNVAAGSGPYPLSASQLWIKDAVRGLRFFNVPTATLPAGPSSTIVSFSAESPGSAYSLPMGTGLSLISSFPGVTAALSAPVGSGTWLTTQGTDAEAAEAAKTRVRAKWATIGILKTQDAYIYLLMTMPHATALPSVKPTKVYVDGSNPRGPMTLDIWFAGPTGPLGASDEAIVQAYLVERKGPNTDLLSGNAETVTLTVTATVYVYGGFEQAIAQATNGIIALVNGLPIGGKLKRSHLHEAISIVPGVESCDLDSVKINGSALDFQLLPKKLGVNGAHALAKVMAT